MGPFQVGGKLPFDKLRANGQACSFALSLSKGKCVPKLKYDPKGSSKNKFPRLAVKTLEKAG
jgi:hypothetical protein